jgi:hypothetical protein
MKKLALYILPILLTACMTPEKAKTASTYKLCDVLLTVTTQSSVVAAENELKARGETCDRYVGAIMANEQMRRSAAANLSAVGAAMSAQGQPKTLSAPAQSNQPMNCRVIPNQYGDKIECR